MSDQLSAQVSDLLFIVAIAVYVLAMVGFAADLAGSAQRASDARLARRDAARVAAGARSSGASGAVAVLDRDDDRADAAGFPVDASASDGRGMTAGWFAMAMTGAAALAHVIAVVLRGVATHRVPWSNMYEFAMTGSAMVIVIFLLLVWQRRDMRVLGTFVVAPMLILMMVAQRMWYIPAAQLPPSLQNSHWLVIHVLVAIASSALFTIGAVVSVLQLVQARRERRGTATGRLAAVMDRLPASTELEAFAFRIHAIGFVLWTFTLIFGSIWASTAWGRYWGWDPKEVWTFVIWVVYAAYLHARATVGFRGSRAAWFSLVGFACVIFNFTIVNTVINGLHSYSGLT
ncbi:c-type cytochrome biogenesis protein CcsB [Brachybacterium huguangmaarense]